MGEGLKRAAKRSNYPNTPEPAVGQRWADNDKRFAHQKREVVIRSVSEGKAHCDIHDGGVRTGRRSSIRLDRLVPKSTGYRFVGVAEVGAAVLP